MADHCIPALDPAAADATELVPSWLGLRSSPV